MSRHANKLSFVLFPRESAFDQSIECEYKFEWGRNGKASEGGEWHSSEGLRIFIFRVQHAKASSAS